VAGESGSFTSIEVLQAVLEFFSSFSVSLVIGQADCSFKSVHHMLQALSIYQLGKQVEARIINLSEGPAVDVNVPCPNVLKRLRVSYVLCESMIVSVPVLKTHPWTGITINMNNMYGAVYEKEKAYLHNGLGKNIVDINKVIALICA
jgi:uncharacterized protein (DUF362 family)